MKKKIEKKDGKNEKAVRDKLTTLKEALDRKNEELYEVRFEPDSERKAERLKKEIEQIVNETGKLMLVEKAYEFAAEAREYIELAKDLIDSNKAEAAGVIRLLLGVFIDIRKDLEPDLSALSDINARALFRDYGALKGVGFGDEQAFQIILARIKPLGGHIGTAQRATSAAAATSATAKLLAEK